MTRTDKKFEGVDLSAIVDSEISDARAYSRIEVEGKRARNLEYLQGVMRDVPALPNRSKLVSSDVRDVISWIHPSLMRVFTSSSQIVEYEAVDEGQDQWAREATDFMNYDFMRNNPGYQLIYNATWDALAQSNGLVCSYWKPAETKRETLEGLTASQIAMLADDESILKDDETGLPVIHSQKDAGEVLVQSEYTNPDGSVMPVEAAEQTWDVRIERITKKARICDETLKPENLFLNDMATTIEEARFCAYLFDNYTRSDLMAMADYYEWDKDTIRDLPSFTPTDGGNDAVGQARMMESVRSNDSPTKSGDYISLYRCFALVDVDGDDVAERIEVWYAGEGGAGTVLSWDLWEDDIPYTDIPCYPVPHRFDGESSADRAADIQRVKTVLLRATADNLYASNMPMREVEAGTVLNPDILVNPIFGGIIWRKLNSVQTAGPVRDLNIPFFAEKSLAAMSYFDDALAKRTGISRSTMALDPEALQNQTATGVQQQRDAGYTQVEIIARNMAEFGWARFFKKRLNLTIKYQKVARIPDKMAGQGGSQPFRQVSPRDWSDEMACTVNVGLGTGSKDRDMAMLSNLMGVQKGMAESLGAIPGGQAKALEYIPKIISTAIKLAESAGLKNPDNYFVSVGPEELQQMAQSIKQAQQQQPNPKLEEIQAKGAVDAQLKQVDAQVSMRDSELKAQGDIIKNKAELEADLQTKQADRDNSIALENIKQQYENQREAERLAVQERIAAENRQLEREKMAFQAQMQRDSLASSAYIAAQRSQELNNRPSNGNDQA